MREETPAELHTPAAISEEGGDIFELSKRAGSKIDDVDDSDDAEQCSLSLAPNANACIESYIPVVIVVNVKSQSAR